MLEFGGKAKYSAPEFIWGDDIIGPTALKFLNSDKLGKQYQNDIFVGDVHNGRIYHFDLNEARTGLLLEGPLDDKVADDEGENDGIVFGEGFGSISDLEVGPDGYLYVVSIGLGGIYRIVPGGANGNDGLAEDIDNDNIIGTAEDDTNDDDDEG